MPIDLILFHSKLEDLRKKYEHLHYLETDPICFPKKYKDPLDMEVVSFISCLYAYGNVKSIQRFLEPIFEFLGPSPYQSLRKEGEPFDSFLKNLGVYRFQTKKDNQIFFLTLARVLRNLETKSPLFESKLIDCHGKFEEEISISQFQKFWEDELKTTLGKRSLSYGLQFLIGKPEAKSPKKRLSLFLRWMVRKSYPDFGLYQKIQPNQIPFPLDVHIQKLIRILGITDRKSFGVKEAYLIKEFFKEISPTDPLLYDFYLTRVGIIERCNAKYEKGICEVCYLKDVCLVFGSATGN
ncbi:TIGR02757 family protein [Leptospira sp. 2 VSF19]|uniref:TIGR02757 family protein n=1 Tax=Leptospira soteropolitanensis TaxID=2950025 RepID=A0AAW5VLN4_9LEPT|nr:TIGR02757 family protein [Leptospira soteropolitanensis]MCW7493259.1 TIGR02757 family protein [Leptospira soteropolitanensis]MCW7500672.1 TIGR02757 family protein [Leptospira soteropolitanensis]MCW7523109.1 TIGR02757 family protein [Leptospira soteropolitanensis]MCW7526784.1 TIGR02757 family protein [Leptospira soteropolitanensis]MCW7530827.1 TIGR02757 family protein [Leptospira soteropolitanensis]